MRAHPFRIAATTRKRFPNHPQSPINERRVVRLLLFRDDNARESRQFSTNRQQPRPPERANIQPLVSENREHLGDPPSFSSDFQALLHPLPLPPRPSSSPCLSPLPLLYLPLAVHPFALVLIPRSRDVQHHDGTAAVAASSPAFSSSTVPTLLRSLIPFQPSPVNGFHRRGPHSLGRSSLFLPLSRFPLVSLLPPSILGSIRLPAHSCTSWRCEGVGRLAGCSPDCLPDCKSSGLPRFFLFSSASLLPFPLFALLSWSFRLFYTPLDLHFPPSTSFSFSFWFSLAP